MVKHTRRARRHRGGDDQGMADGAAVAASAPPPAVAPEGEGWFSKFKKSLGIGQTAAAPTGGRSRRHRSRKHKKTYRRRH